jgi:hypothetical protein
LRQLQRWGKFFREQSEIMASENIGGKEAGFIPDASMQDKCNFLRFSGQMGSMNRKLLI